MARKKKTTLFINKCDSQPDRRDILKRGATLTGVMSLPGCASLLSSPILPQGVPGIDVHTHVFNASDLPVKRFITITMLGDHRDRELADLSKASTREFLFALIELILDVLQDRAPTARQEIAILDPSSRAVSASELQVKSITGARPIPKSSATNSTGRPLFLDTGEEPRSETRDFEIKILRRVLGNLFNGPPTIQSKELLEMAPDFMPSGFAGELSLEQQIINGRKRVQDRLLEELDESRSDFQGYLQNDESQLSKVSIANIFGAVGIVVRHLAWAISLLRYRYQNLNKYQRNFSGDGEVVLHIPLLIDYSKWLRNEYPDTPLIEQVELMDILQQTRESFRMQSFVAYDPWRQICATAKCQKPPTGHELPPRALLDTAISKHGFIGVKLYPPMGFLPFGNVDLPPKAFPKELRDLGPDFRVRLDEELLSLYRHCLKHGIPILAHAENSNMAGPDYGRRASPDGWGEVMGHNNGELKELRICLGHFGSFDEALDKNGEIVSARLEDTWEWKFGHLIHAGDVPNFIYDFSFFSELIEDNGCNGARMKSVITLTKLFISKFDQDVEHIAYGSDWIMMGKEPNYKKYVSLYGDFADRVGLVGQRRENFFSKNAARWLGVTKGNLTRERLEDYDRETRNDPQFWQRFDQHL